MDQDRLRAFSVENVCQRLGLHRTTVQKLLREGRLKGFKIGRIWKIPAASLDEFLRVESGLPEPEPTPEPAPGPTPETALESAMDDNDEFRFNEDIPAAPGEDAEASGKKPPRRRGGRFSAAFSRRFSSGPDKGEDS